jgi:hypothetical protein
MASFGGKNYATSGSVLHASASSLASAQATEAVSGGDKRSRNYSRVQTTLAEHAAIGACRDAGG